ncbi:MAG: glycerol-3-phosphate 1-O-acyltransferase PlsY [Burkholderiaceae bacterium]|nr:glycerol-3-phosphate 1-O-acyltransferase PlsY [Burkholderiaceae bacterium]
MAIVVWSVLAVVGAYLIGSLSFAVIISRVVGLADPRSYGSKNPGATNVLRSGNKAAAVATLVLDAVKGWLPLWAVGVWGPGLGLGDGTFALVGLAAFVGHLFPVFFHFKGGKGVATAVGVLFGVNWVLALAALATFAVLVFFTRYVSLASIVAAVFAPVYFLFGTDVAWPASPPMAGALVAMGALLVWRHTDNINRLIQGKESRLGKKSA